MRPATRFLYRKCLEVTKLITKFADKERLKTMIWLLSPTASTLLGLFVAGYAALTGAKSVARGLFSARDKGSVRFTSPFIQLDVSPVSEGDRVVYAFFLNGEYTAHIENRKKKARLDYKAGTKEELERQVQDTFRAWAVTGKKKKDWPHVRVFS